MVGRNESEGAPNLTSIYVPSALVFVPAEPGCDLQDMPVPKAHHLPKSWKSTIHLPRTAFPPRAASHSDQAKYLKRCTDEVYAWQKEQPRAEVFTLHDGPPYANGKLHIGHALNKILKDITCRFQLSQNKRVNWFPGWDCHGLPIELMAVGKLAAKTAKNDENALSTSLPDPLKIRRAARELATKTVEDQKAGFRAWGIMADWKNPWRTMDKSFEMRQLEVFKEMVKKGLIYRQYKPVYWSPSSQTALAEAELEYREDHVSTAAFVKMRLDKLPERLVMSSRSDAPIYLLVWTTTPWTLPANRAIAVKKDLKYVIVESEAHGRLVLAESRLEEVQQLSQQDFKIIGSVMGSDLVGSSYRDSIFEDSSSPRPILHADFVSADSGTGLVHIAPGHGVDDYELGLRNAIPAFAPIDNAGRFTALASPKEPNALEGKHILFDGNTAVLQMLSEGRYLFAQHEYTHKYPYDWRSKQPVVLRATEQWFANVGNLQIPAMQALESVKFTPEGSIARLQSFLKSRKEWCISRQRAWGVPIPALYNKATGEAILTEESVSHIISVISERGVDAWWSDDELDPAWIPANLKHQEDQVSFVRGQDTMDVWFDSGTSWTQAQTHQNIADVYLEGSDQHRGWFQSSLLTYLACQDSEHLPQAPFRSLVTHGFTLDEHGRKMSKSIGNVVSPNEIIEGTLLPALTKKVGGKRVEFRDAMGVDALRLWIASSDYTKDISINPVALKAINNTLAKYRITFKQLLGILQNYNPTGTGLPKRLGNVHSVAIGQLENLESALRGYFERMEFHRVIAEINRYINQDLSAFYLEAIKDAAYCGTFQERTAVQQTCGIIHLRLQQLLAPVVPLLVQESWEHTPPQIQAHHGLSPFQRTWTSSASKTSSSPATSLSESEKKHQLDKEIPALMNLLATVQRLQEQARSAKQMGSSLQSFVLLQLESGKSSSLLDRCTEEDLETLLVVSQVQIIRTDSSSASSSSLPANVTSAEWIYTSTFSHSHTQRVEGHKNETTDTEMTVHVYAPQRAKCVRCWRYKAAVPAEDVTKQDEAETLLCQRCEGVVEELRLERAELFVMSE